MEKVFFRKWKINDESKNVVIVVSSAPLTQVKAEIAGFAVGARTQQNLQFGILALTDPKTGNSMKADHPTFKSLQAKLKVGDEMPGFRISDTPITNKETGEAINGLFWAEPA